VAGGTQYEYRVLARNGQVASMHSNMASVLTRPDAPATVTAAAASPTQINLVWSDVAGEAGYRIERWVDGAGWVAVGTVGPNVTSFMSTDLSGGVVHYHRVVAIGEAGESAASYAVAAATPAAPRATAVFAGNDYATKGAWLGVRGAEGYIIPGLAQSLPSNVTFNVGGAAPLSWGATEDPRSLQAPQTPAARWASGWAGTGAMDFDFNFSDGATHRLSMYLLDEKRAGVALHVQLIDIHSGRVLVQQPVSGFEEGRYLSWDVKGAVRVRVSAIGAGAPVVNGFFLDPVAAAAPAVASAPPAPVRSAVAASPLGRLFSYSSVLDWYRRQVRLQRGSLLRL
jgi:hypothetical protein